MSIMRLIKLATCEKYDRQSTIVKEIAIELSVTFAGQNYAAQRQIKTYS